jgi:hypothetical protein
MLLRRPYSGNGWLVADCFGTMLGSKRESAAGDPPQAEVARDSLSLLSDAA